MPQKCEKSLRKLFGFVCEKVAQPQLIPGWERPCQQGNRPCPITDDRGGDDCHDTRSHADTYYWHAYFPTVKSDCPSSISHPSISLSLSCFGSPTVQSQASIATYILYFNNVTRTKYRRPSVCAVSSCSPILPQLTDLDACIAFSHPRLSQST